MAQELGPMSGFRDMLAEQMIPRQEILDTIRKVYEGYGFVPLKTPALERHSTLTGKYGEEGEKLMYKFEDNGGRMVALRYDHTVPLARVVAQHRGRISLPYKRYVVGEVWRGESPQAGRYREFTQFDADTVGTKSPIADAEIVAMMSDSMAELGADSIIRVNNRRILDALVEEAGITTEAEARQFVGLIDKVEKIGQVNVLTTIAEQNGDKVAQLVSDYLGADGPSLSKLRTIRSLLKNREAMDEGHGNLYDVFNMLREAGYHNDRVVFDPTIARGLDYYTGIIYETTLKGAPELGSVCSGGRFDNLVEALGGPDIPAVGTSIGVDRLYDGLLKLGITKEARTNTEVLVTNYDQGDSTVYMKIATLLRNSGVASEVYYDQIKLGKQISFANSQGIPFVVIAGPDEIERGIVQLKHMESGEQREVTVAELADVIKSNS